MADSQLAMFDYQRVNVSHILTPLQFFTIPHPRYIYIYISIINPISLKYLDILTSLDNWYLPWYIPLVWHMPICWIPIDIDILISFPSHHLPNDPSHLSSIFDRISSVSDGLDALIVSTCSVGQLRATNIIATMDDVGVGTPHSHKCIYIYIILYIIYNVGKTIIHKLPMTGNCNHTTYKNDDDWGMAYSCFTHITIIHYCSILCCTNWGYPDHKAILGGNDVFENIHQEHGFNSIRSERFCVEQYPFHHLAVTLFEFPFLEVFWQSWYPLVN